MVVKQNAFIQSWEIVKKNKILFVPNLLILVSNIILLALFLHLTGLRNVIVNNQYDLLKELVLSARTFFLFLLYLISSMLIDNLFFTAKYGLIKDILLKKKTNLKKAFNFAEKYYWTTLEIHVLSILVVVVPIILLIILLLSLLPVNTIAAVTIFVPLLIAYLIYITIRLLFVYPVMTFEKKGAYNSLVEDFHFVKNHFSHTFVTWLIVLLVSIFASIVKENVGALSNSLREQLFFMAVLAAVLIIFVELVVSVWEQVFIFKSYLSARKKKKRRK